VEAGGRKRVDEVLGGGSYYSQSSFVLHFGLGNVSRVDRLEVRWPSGLVQQWTDFQANRTLKLVEGDARFN